MAVWEREFRAPPTDIESPGKATGGPEAIAHTREASMVDAKTPAPILRGHAAEGSI
jgi:hypothetical protein